MVLEIYLALSLIKQHSQEHCVRDKITFMNML